MYYALSYSLLTILTIPGIPHFATEGEVFDQQKPSRAVRAFLGLYEWELETQDIW
jgi:hypothetical protein